MGSQYYHDVLVIGGGAAGLTLALHLAPFGRIALLTKGPLHEGATLYAQGGISAVLDQHDSIESHVADTIKSGAGLCDEAVVRFAVSESKACIEWLIDCGVPFTRSTDTNNSSSGYHLTREGGHSHRRVIHAADATGKALENTLESQLINHPNIVVFERSLAIDLVVTDERASGTRRCIGAYVLNTLTGHIDTHRARFVVLATGGAGKVYLYTSNPDVATGDGIAMAWRAGCRVANMEFVQFHPTCLYHPAAKSYLITEAVRGEGGRLLLPGGERFMPRFDARAELAPRDIVARAIDHEMKRLGISHVYLDISHKPADFILAHFPNVYRRCLEFGFDMTRAPIPVVPAAHYTCGGIMTDLHGRTDIAGLYAIGETAYTGLHGANRMASNSLLECLVFGRAAARDIHRQLAHSPPPPEIPDWDESRVTESSEEVVVAHDWDELRRTMWDYVGIVRTTKRLRRAKERIDLLAREINDYYATFKVTSDLIELRNLVVVADLIVTSALSRRESRGLHYSSDFPEPDHESPPQPTVLSPDRFPGSVV